MSTLYELASDYLQLLDMLQDPNEDSEVINDTLEFVEADLEIKAENYAKIIKELEGEAVKLKTEIDRLTAKKRHTENSISKVKETLYNAMVATGKRKFKTDLFSFNIQKNGGAAPVIVDVETKDLPDELVIYTEKPDLKALGELLKSDPECKYAHYGERGESLRIK